jgi:hypothetical protein
MRAGTQRAVKTVARPRLTKRVEADLNRESFAALLADEIPAIRIRNFATAQECAAFADAVRRRGLRFYSVARRIGYIGLAQYEYRWDRPKEDYFRDVIVADREKQAVLDASFDAVRRLIDRLAEHYPAGRVGIAEEALGPYYAGIIRQASEGVDLHADFAPLNAPAYVIGSIDAQLGWNFYAEGLIAGGETTVHHAPWTPEMRPGEIPKSYGLPREIVSGAETFTFTPDIGDVVIFNTRNPHEIAGGEAGSGRERISIGSFIGRLPNRDLVLWS